MNVWRLYDAERQAWMQAAHTGRLGDFFEDIIKAVYSAILRPGDLAVDCGASGGLHTVPVSELVGPSGRVVAVEAIPDLAAGLAQRGFPNVDVKATAIGAAAGRASFSVVRDKRRLQRIAAAPRPARRPCRQRRCDRRAGCHA